MQDNILSIEIRPAYNFERHLYFQSIKDRDAFRANCRLRKNRELLCGCNLSSVAGGEQYPLLRLRCYTESQVEMLFHIARDFGGVEAEIDRTP